MRAAQAGDNRLRWWGQVEKANAGRRPADFAETQVTRAYSPDAVVTLCLVGAEELPDEATMIALLSFLIGAWGAWDVTHRGYENPDYQDKGGSVRHQSPGR